MKKFYHKTEKLTIYKLKIMHYTSEQPRKNPANLFAGRFLCFCFCKTFSEQYIYKYRYRRQHHQRNDQSTVCMHFPQFDFIKYFLACQQFKKGEIKRCFSALLN